MNEMFFENFSISIFIIVVLVIIWLIFDIRGNIKSRPKKENMIDNTALIRELKKEIDKQDEKPFCFGYNSGPQDRAERDCSTCKFESFCVDTTKNTIIDLVDM